MGRMMISMRPKTMKTSHPQVSPAVVDPEQLWFVSDARIRTKGASEEAIRIAEWIATRREGDEQPNEQQLFAAMHTAAYRAARKSRTRQIPRKERIAWAERWQTLRSYLV